MEHNTLTEISAMLEALISFRSTASRPAERDACMEYLQAWCVENQLEYECMLVHGVQSLYVGAPDYQADVLLLSHYDVVEGPDALFTPHHDAERLYGRGSLDDKYAVVLSLLLYRDYQRAFPGTRAPFMLLITGDEETDSDNGAAVLLERLHPRCAFALDGGSPHEVMIRGKGILRLELVAHGKAAHGAHPWMGVNAMDMLCEDYATLKRLFAAQYDLNADHWMTTCTMGTVQAGSVVNKVPGTARAMLDIRYTTEEDPDELVARLKKSLKSTLTVIQKEPAFYPMENTWIQRLVSLIPNCVQGSMHGATDARFLSQQGIPSAVWGAEGGESEHSDAEYVELSSLETLWNTLKKMFGMP